MGFLGWMKLFAYYRYEVPLEVLLPICFGILWPQVLPAPQAGRAFR
jgi:hypothetical protein